MSLYTLMMVCVLGKDFKVKGKNSEGDPIEITGFIQTMHIKEHLS